MLIPPHRASRNLNPLANRVIHPLIRHNDVSPLRKRRDHAGYSREGLGVDDTSRHAEEGSHVRFGAHVDVLGAVEAGGTAGADAVRAKGLDCFLLEGFVGDEVVEVVGGEVGYGAAVCEFGFGARGAIMGLASHSPFSIISLQFPNLYIPSEHNPSLDILFVLHRRRRNKRIRSPIVYQIVNFLPPATSNNSRQLAT